MEEALRDETELGGIVECSSSPGHSAQQESEQLKAVQLSSKPNIDLCPPLIAIKKGKEENNTKNFMLPLYGEKIQEQNGKLIKYSVQVCTYKYWVGMWYSERASAGTLMCNFQLYK